MRNTFLLLFSFLLLAGTGLQAQECDLPNSSFEVFEDLTIEFDTTGTLPLETITLPEGYFSFIRLFFLAFDVTIGNLGLDVAENFFGITQVDNATDGESAVLIGGNSLVPLADLSSSFTCDGALPQNLVMDIGHLGTRIDTLNLIVAFGENTIIPNTQEDFLNTAGFISVQLIADQEIDYQEFSFPITDNMNGVSADSVFLTMIVLSDTLSLDPGEQAGFLIDNLRFMSEPSSVETPELAAPVKVYPMPFSENLFIENENEALEAKIFDTAGKLIKTFDVQPGVSDYNMQELQNSGNYILELRGTEVNQRSTYNIIKG